MKRSTAPPTQPRTSSRASRLATGLIAGMVLVSTPALADPPVERAPSERATAERSTAPTAAELADASVVLAGETPETAITRIEGEVEALEVAVTEAETCTEQAQRSRQRQAACPNVETSKESLVETRTRLARARRHESLSKRRIRAQRQEMASKYESP